MKRIIRMPDWRHHRFSKWGRRLLRTVAVVLIILTASWIALTIYVNTHKKELLKAVMAQINENINGELYIEKMEPALIRGFPNVSIKLSNVSMHDSLWPVHHRNLLQAQTIYAEVNIFSILRGKPTLHQISVEHGTVFIFTDANGYSNTNIFRSRAVTGKPKESGAGAKINRVLLNDVNIEIRNDFKQKLMQFYVKHLAAKLKYDGADFKGDIDMDVLIKAFSFNTERGTFFKDRRLTTDLDLTWDNEKKILNIPEQNLWLNDDKVKAGFRFTFGAPAPAFDITVKAPSITYGSIVSMLPENIAKKLRPMNLDKPLNGSAHLTGVTAGGGQPQIHAQWTVTDNTFTTPAGPVTNCSFTGSFNNQTNILQPSDDDNSTIATYNMKGEWNGLPFASDTMFVYNLMFPKFYGNFAADFPLTKLNDASLGELFDFTNGTAKAKLHYEARLDQNDTLPSSIRGTVELHDGAMTYRPRGIPFSNCNATLQFTGSDLFFHNLTAQSGSSKLQMEGSMLNFLSIYYANAGKIQLDWHVKSPLINLSEFMAFAGKRTTRKAGNNSNFADRLDEAIDKANAHVTLQVDHMKYKKVNATNINADITLEESEIAINNISLSDAGGTIQLTGNMSTGNTANRFSVQAKLNNVGVQQVFASMDNFGQTAITDQNLRGQLNASANLTGTMNTTNGIVPGSLNGSLSFNLQNGAILNFEPFQKLGKLVFRNRNMSEVTFSKLENTFDIQGKKITIHPMQIESSALTVFAEGVYTLDNNGTEVLLDVPLRNPKKDELIDDDELRAERSKKGLVVHLKAVDGDDGKVKIKLNGLFKRKDAKLYKADASAEADDNKKKDKKAGKNK